MSSGITWLLRRGVSEVTRTSDQGLFCVQAVQGLSKDPSRKETKTQNSSRIRKV